MKRLLVLVAALALTLTVAPTATASTAEAPAPLCANATPSVKVQKILTASKLKVTATTAPVGARTAFGINRGLMGFVRDSSPHWVNDADGRHYWYRVDTAARWFQSEPCSGDDAYAFEFIVECFRSGPPNFDPVDTPCQFDRVNAHLRRSYGAQDPWTSYGWKQFARGNDVACEAAGGKHAVVDGSTFLSTSVVEHLYFLNPFGSGQLHSTSARRINSIPVLAGAETLVHDPGDIYEGQLNTPPNWPTAVMPGLC